MSSKIGGVNSQESIIIDEFIQNLEAVTEQVKQLLIHINDSKIELATIKSELKFAVSGVKELLQLYTRAAMVEEIATEAKEYISHSIERDIAISSKAVQIEEKLKNLEYKIERIAEDIKVFKTDKNENIVRRSTGKWQIYTALIAGGFGTIGVITNIIISFFN